MDLLGPALLHNTLQKGESIILGGLFTEVLKLIRLAADILSYQVDLKKRQLDGVMGDWCSGETICKEVGFPLDVPDSLVIRYCVDEKSLHSGRCFKEASVED